MKNIFKASKRGIGALLTLCILLGIAGISVHATAMAEEKPTATEENTVASEKTTPELRPMMARGCGDNDYGGYDYSKYDGSTYNSTSEGLKTVGIPLGTDGSVMFPFEMITGVRGGDLCVFVYDKTTDRLACWFKVRQW